MADSKIPWACGTLREHLEHNDLNRRLDNLLDDLLRATTKKSAASSWPRNDESERFEISASATCAELYPKVIHRYNVGQTGLANLRKNRPTNEEKLARWAKYQLEVDRLHEKNPRLSDNGINKRVAEMFGVTPKTIGRRTQRPK